MRARAPYQYEIHIDTLPCQYHFLSNQRAGLTAEQIMMIIIVTSNKNAFQSSVLTAGRD